MNAVELLTSLASVQGAREVRAGAPLGTVALVAGIEVGVSSSSSERTMRRAWKDRHGGGATPLLVVADDPGRAGCVLALGLVEATAVIRSVEARALSKAFERIGTLSRLEAVRELTAELERLDRAGIPGVKVRGLLTLHTLDVRLRGDRRRWLELETASKAVPGEADWRAALTGLGFELERRQQRGYLARWQGRPIAVVHPKADPTEFARWDEENRPPEGVLLNDCLSDGAPFGLLASGGRLRLFEVDPSLGSAAGRYLDLDSGALQEDDRPFLGLLSPAYLAEGGFDALAAEARSFGSALRRRLDKTIRETVLPSLGRALGRWAGDQGQDLKDESVREEIERAALTAVFRAIFLLYAESAGYLPMDNQAYRKGSLTALVEEAAESLEQLDPGATSLWDRFHLLVKAMRKGDRARGVPPYNGALFAADGFEGAGSLERVSVPDPDFGQVLIGLGRDAESTDGIDYSTLEIGHLGHIYEGLLSLRLSVADLPLCYDPKADRYRAAEPGGVVDVQPGDVLWQTHEGGRKGGGVYYTRSELVRHLVRQTVVPAFAAHLDRVRERAATDPAGAAEELLDFAVLDPACGSAHFLVSVTNELADATVRFLADVPLPDIAAAIERLRAGASAGTAIDDVALLRRLLLKRCVYGVDLSPMGVEVAKLSLWLACFVPGLSLAYLDRNIQVGNSLVGVAHPEALRPPPAKTKHGHAAGQRWTLEDALQGALQAAATAVRRLAEIEDRNPTEYEESIRADKEAHVASAGMERLFNVWTAEPFGLKGARQEVEIHGAGVLDGSRSNDIVASAQELATTNDFMHWLPAFPRAFARPRPGFDAVVGNPPWEEVTVEELAFYGLFKPGIRTLPEEERRRAVETLLSERPELRQRLEAAKLRAKEQRAYLGGGEYLSMAGDPDLYKFFCQRYGTLLRDGGALGVVLPRSTFSTDGSEGFRRWLFEQTSCERIDFLLNKGCWAFDSEPRYTIALVAAKRETPATEHRVRVAGTATSVEEWEAQTASAGLALALDAFGPGWTVPLLRNQEEADLLLKLRRGSRFPFGSGSRWRTFAVAELHETNDRRFWEGAEKGRPLWKGESFEQFDPHGAEARICGEQEEVWKKVRKPKPGAGSVLSSELPLTVRRKAVLDEIKQARIAFRDVSRATDSRTVRACLVPPKTFLTNKAPYLTFVPNEHRVRAACLAIMNSLPFDWQARRFVEVNLNFFILEGLTVPDLQDDDFEAVADAAGRLSSVDERFAAFAETVGVDCGPLEDEERQRLRIEIDARVAQAWALTQHDLEVLLADFTVDAVPADYRKKLRDRLSELSR